MAEEIPQVEPKKTPTRFLKELNYTEIALIVIFIGYLVYLHNITSLVPNFNSGNQTRIINGIQNPPNTVLYGNNAFVPKSNITNTQLFFGLILFIIVILFLLAKRVSQLRRATMKEAMDDISKQIKQLRNVPLADGTTIPLTNSTKLDITPQFQTKYRTIGDKRDADKYSFLVMFENKSMDEIRYFKARYHPFTRYWDDFYEIPRPLSDIDKCPKCGTDSDIKVVIAEDITKLRDLKKAIAGVTGGRL